MRHFKADAMSKAVAKKLHTPKVIAEFKAKMAENEKKMKGK